MDKTKNDLSHGKAELDYQALVKTTEVAFCHSRNEIFRQLQKLQGTDMMKSCFYLNAGHLLDEATNLAIVSETLYTLYGGLVREEVTIVNKPEQKEF